MKKKFFAVALATTMALSSTVFAATADVNIGGAFSANTGDEVLKGNFDVTYTFNNKSVGTNNWDNFVLEIFDGAGQYITLRADAFGWTAGSWTLGGEVTTLEDGTVHPAFTGAAADWAAWMTDMKAGCDVTVNVKRTGKVFDVTYTYGNTAKDVMKTKVTVNEDVAETVNLHLTGEKVNLTNVKFTNNTNAGSNNNTKPSNETTAPTTKAPETTTEEETTTAAPAAAGKVEVTSTDAPVYDKDGNSLGNIKVDIKGAEESVQKTVLSLIDSKYTDKINTKSPVLVLDITAAQFEPADGKCVKVTYDLTNTDLKDKTDLTVYRLEADNTLKEMSNVELKDNKISFTTEHFSTYVIAQKVVKETKPETTPTNSKGTGDAAPIVVFVAVAVVAAGVVASRKKLV